jgi:hypothetical protein
MNSALSRNTRLDGDGYTRGYIKMKIFEGVKDPLRSSFMLLDFSRVPLIEVLNKALNLDH